jgi:hypothetical protein
MARRALFRLLFAVTLAGVCLGMASAASAPSPVFGVSIPPGYRSWQLVSVHQAQGLLKAIWGNAVAMDAQRKGTLPFPDGTILVKQTWKGVALNGFASTLVAGPAVHLQVMVKDARRWPKTGGWGFGEWVDGKPASVAVHQTCYACHTSNAQVVAHDFEFTTYAP